MSRSEANLYTSWQQIKLDAGSAVDDLEGRAWLLERFGTDGAPLRTGLPAMLLRRHLGMADAQERAPMRAHAVYGQIWRAVHDGMEEDFGSLPSAQLYRPPSAPYKIMIVNGTALFPWRFAHDAVTELDQASLGAHVSPTRQLVLAGVAVPDMLPFVGPPADDPDDDAVGEIERYRAAFREVAAAHPVVVVAYASNPVALLSAYWGDVRQLRADGTLDWGWREQFDLTQPIPPGRHLSVVRDDDGRPSFTSSPLQTPAIRPRSGHSDGRQDSDRPGGRG
jgi:hypothetical protein